MIVCECAYERSTCLRAFYRSRAEGLFLICVTPQIISNSLLHSSRVTPISLRHPGFRSAGAQGISPPGPAAAHQPREVRPTPDNETAEEIDLSRAHVYFAQLRPRWLLCTGLGRSVLSLPRAGVPPVPVSSRRSLHSGNLRVFSVQEDRPHVQPRFWKHSIDDLVRASSCL